jgi:hypothetical protein
VLDDIDLLARSLLAGGDPRAVETCVALVEHVAAAGGGRLAADASDAVGSAARPHETGGDHAAVQTVSGIDVHAALVPKSAVSADFVSRPLGDRLAIAIGDAPASGLERVRREVRRQHVQSGCVGRRTRRPAC